MDEDFLDPQFLSLSTLLFHHWSFLKHGKLANLVARELAIMDENNQ